MVSFRNVLRGTLKLGGNVKRRIFRYTRAVLFITLPLIPAFVILIGGAGTFMYDYTQNNPAFCTNCHLMNTAYAKWNQSIHSRINCHECHITSINDMKRVYEVIFVKPEEVGPHNPVNPMYCLKCHVHTQEEWISIQNTIGHRVHFVEKNLTCTNCHVLSIHEFTPPTDVCLRCHQKSIRVSGMRDFHCLNCHEFTATGRDELRPGRESCLSCHRLISNITTTRVSFPENAHSKSLCYTCHIPHEAKVPRACEGCHVASPGGIHNVQTHQLLRCVTCHQQHNADTRKTCLQCHGNKKEHNSPLGCNVCHNEKRIIPWG
jgi:nitrate/TMAO reductase-like tetraheme cytochrome c subunit